MNTKKILIVDDDPDILEALQLTFELEGYEAVALSKGEETFQLVDQFRPDAIILDVLLSGKDGRTICRDLKSSDKTKHIPIIMISAHPDAARSTIAVGADDFIAKPFDINTLIGKVSQYLHPSPALELSSNH